MVSEQRISYAAAVAGESSHRSRSTTRIMQSPIHTRDPQRNSAPQRSINEEDVENPLFLSSNESSNAILVSPPLAGSTNYSTWSISMQVALEVKNKWWIIDGSVAEPEVTEARYPPWRRCNLMICSWICRSVHPSIIQSIMYMKRAKDVWNDFKKRFAQRDAHQISILQGEIYGLKQGKFLVNEYYTRCRGLWEQMNELRLLPMCKCEPSGSCDLLEIIKDERETDQIIRFLEGLNTEYNSLKSNILVLDPLPDIHRVYVMTEKFERQLQTDAISDLEVAHANATQISLTNEDIVAAVNNF